MFLELAKLQPLSESAWNLPLLSLMSVQPDPGKFRDPSSVPILCKVLLDSVNDTKMDI